MSDPLLTFTNWPPMTKPSIQLIAVCIGLRSHASPFTSNSTNTRSLGIVLPPTTVGLIDQLKLRRYHPRTITPAVTSAGHRKEAVALGIAVSHLLFQQALLILTRHKPFYG